MESPVRTITLLINKDTGYGILMENDEVIRENIPPYTIDAFIKGL